MKWWKVIVFSVAFAFVAGTAFAEEAKVSVDFGAGYRSDKLDWSITGPVVLGGPDINPISELSYDNLNIAYAKSTVRMSYKRFHFKGGMDLGKIIGGNYQDSDYTLSGRNAEFSRSNGESRGHVFDASMGIGYEIPVGKVTIIPLIGYSWHLQNIKMRDGVQTISNYGFPVPLGTILTGLNSSYDARWQGVWVGVDLNAQPSDRFRIYSSVSYHFGNYVGQGVWNLRSLEFEQLADANGWDVSGGASYSIKDSTDLGLEVGYTDWTTREGKSEGLSSVFTSKFNRAEWRSYSIMFNATHRFYSINKNKRLSRM